MPDTVTKPAPSPPLDDETAAALTLYNTYLAADRGQQAHERALRKAEKAKDDAAATVREFNRRKAPTAETAEAEAKYRETVEALRRLRDGDAPANAKPEQAAQDTDDEPPESNDAPDSEEPPDSNAQDTENTAEQAAQASDDDEANDETVDRADPDDGDEAA